MPSYQANERWQTRPSVKAQRVETRFRPGMRINHPIWSQGMVLNSVVQDDDEIVDIFFEDVGLKRVAASLAKLEIIQ